MTDYEILLLLDPDLAEEPQAEVVAIEGAKHLWVGETQTRRVLTEIVAAVNPDALPLPEEPLSLFKK